MTPHRRMLTFYTIILTQTLSLIGSRISGLAIGFYIFEQTQQATPLALVSFFSVIPMILASSIFGVLADRWDRRLVMIIADAGQAVGTVLLLLSFLSGTFEIWHLYVITFFQSIFGVFQAPAFQASVTMLIPDHQRDRANAIQQLTGPMAGVIAPMIAGVVFAAVGVVGSILVDLTTFLVAVVIILNVRIPRPEVSAEGAAARGSIWRESLGGFAYLLQHKTLLACLIYISLINFLINGAMTINTPYLLSRTGNAETLGVLLGIMNVGGLIGGVIIGIWGGTRPRVHTIFPGMIFSGVFLMFTGMMSSAPTLGATLLLMMIPLPMANALFMSMMQSKVPPDIQGRVFAVIGQISMLLMPLAALASGPLADNVFEPAVTQAGWEVVAPFVGTGSGAGMGLLFVLFGAGVWISTVIVYAIPAIRRIETTLPDYEPIISTDSALEIETALSA